MSSEFEFDMADLPTGSSLSLSSLSDNSRTRSSCTDSIHGEFSRSQVAMSKICVEALQAGSLEAFIHTFHLSHRPPVLVDPIAETYLTLDVSDLKGIQLELIHAEELQREGQDMKKVYEVYHDLARIFEDNGDIDTAEYFHRKGQEVARLSSDSRLVSLAHSNHGKLFERRGNMPAAARHFETHLALAETGDDLDDTNEARREVVRIYVRMADKFLEGGDTQNARVLLDKCYATARKTDDKRFIADMAHRCGHVYAKLNDIHRALEFHQMHFDLCSDLMDDDQKAKALSYLGSLYEQIGMVERSLGLLKDMLSLAEERVIKMPSQESERVVGEAHEKLGNLLMAMNRPEDAADHFEKNFKMAIESGDEKWAVAARIRLGFARGEQALQSNTRTSSLSLNATAHES